jgi:hypothetical protein
VNIQRYAPFGIRFAELDAVTLTDRERATLGKAADLLHRIREARVVERETDYYAGDEDDADMVFGWRICDELARTGRLVLG